jgi:hypothetical protein
MNKISIGRARKKSKEEMISRVGGHGRAADAVFVFGAAAVCVMLTLPLLPQSGEYRLPGDTAVPVMSGAVQTETAEIPEKEELAAPSGFPAETEEWNFYDYMGELFAGLISGQG